MLTMSDDRSARVWEVPSGELVAILRGHGDSLTSGAFSHDGRYIVTAGWDRSARVWAASSGRTVQRLPLRVLNSSDPVAAFSSVGYRVAVSAGNVMHEIDCVVCQGLDGLVSMAERRLHRGLTPQERREFLHE